MLATERALIGCGSNARKCERHRSVRDKEQQGLADSEHVALRIDGRSLLNLPCKVSGDHFWRGKNGVEQAKERGGEVRGGLLVLLSADCERSAD